MFIIGSPQNIKWVAYPYSSLFWLNCAAPITRHFGNGGGKAVFLSYCSTRDEYVLSVSGMLHVSVWKRLMGSVVKTTFNNRPACYDVNCSQRSHHLSWVKLYTVQSSFILPEWVLQGSQNNNLWKACSKMATLQWLSIILSTWAMKRAHLGVVPKWNLLIVKIALLCHTKLASCIFSVSWWGRTSSWLRWHWWLPCGWFQPVASLRTSAHLLHPQWPQERRFIICQGPTSPHIIRSLYTFYRVQHVILYMAYTVQCDVCLRMEISIL